MCSPSSTLRTSDQSHVPIRGPSTPDHAGGNTFRDQDGEVKLSFPKARYVVKRGEYDYATHPNERTSASYFERNFMTIVHAHKFEFVSREKEIARGVRVVQLPAG